MQLHHIQVQPGGANPEEIAKSGQWAAAQAAGGAAAAAGQMGRAFQNLGETIDRIRARQDEINSLRATAALQENVTRYYAESPNQLYTDENGISEHSSAVDRWRTGKDQFDPNWLQSRPEGWQPRSGYDALKGRMAATIKNPQRRQEWLANVESNLEPKWTMVLAGQAEELLEGYVGVVAGQAVRTLALSGNLEAADQIRGQAQKMFLPEEWPRNERKMDMQIAATLAEYDETAARQYVQKYLTGANLTAQERSRLESDIHSNAAAAAARQKKMTEDALDANDRDVYARMMLWIGSKGTDPDGNLPSPATAAALYASQRISKTTFDAVMEVNMNPDRENVTGTLTEALDQLALLEQGKISRADYDRWEQSHIHEISNAKLEQFHARANAEYGALFGRVYQESQAAIKASLEPYKRQGASNTVWSDYASQLAIADVASQIDREMVQARDKGEAIDPAWWRDRTRTLIDRMRTELIHIADTNKSKDIYQKQEEFLKSLKSQTGIGGSAAGGGAAAIRTNKGTRQAQARVRLIGPDGQLYEVDADEVDEALRHEGWRRPK